MASMRLPSKNMCSVRVRPMPTAPNATAFCACSGVSALVRTGEPGGLGAPFHELAEVLELLGGLGGLVAVDRGPAMISDGAVLICAGVDRAERAVDREEVALVEGLAARR